MNICLKLCHNIDIYQRMNTSQLGKEWRDEQLSNSKNDRKAFQGKTTQEHSDWFAVTRERHSPGCFRGISSTCRHRKLALIKTFPHKQTHTCSLLKTAGKL